jgi:uncharacterized membrane protein
MSTNQPAYFRLTRDGSDVTGALGDASGSREEVSFEALTSGTVNSNILNPITFVYVDSPSTTSSVTYGLNVRVQNRTASPGTFYLNRSGTDTSAAAYSRGVSTITVEEILP